jgi:hypothetical protein
MRFSQCLCGAGGAAAFAGACGPAAAIIITITPIETPSCDPLVLPNVVHELGNAPAFPTDELISSTSTFTPLSACPTMDSPAIPNALVVMTNLTPTFWRDVHYVGDAPPTTLSNDDGLVTGGLAFKIDYAGVNVPLVFESIAADGIFAPGETWHFIVQDYVNAFGLPAGALGSIGVGVASGGPDPVSSGSIIALEIPGPGGLSFMLLVGLAIRRRRA